METKMKKNILLFAGVKTRSVIIDLITYLFVLLFIYTGSSKIYAFKDFDIVLSLLPIAGVYHQFFAIAIISIQLIIAVLLIIPITKIAGLHLSFGLLIVFSLCLIYMVLFEKVLPCSCGGITSRLSWKAHIYVNLLLASVAGFGILTNQYIKPKL